MDPTIILKLVREQRRQINDTFNPQQRVSPICSSSPLNSPLLKTTFHESLRPSKTEQSIYSNQSEQNFIKNIKNDNFKFFHPAKSKNNESGLYCNDVTNFQSQNFQNLNETFYETESFKYDKLIHSNLSNSNNFNGNTSHSNDIKRFPDFSSIPHHNSPFKLIKKKKKIDEVYQDKYSPRIYNSCASLPNNFSNLNSKLNNFPIQNNYLNEQICTKECCVPVKHLKYQEGMIKNASSITKSYFCECNECIELTNMNYCSKNPINTKNSHHNFRSTCDCPSCNMPLIRRRMPMFSQKSLTYPTSPIPTNGFVISQNSSFSPITPSNKSYTNNYKNKNNYYAIEGFDKKRYQIISHPVNKCFCSDCKTDEGQKIDNNHYKSDSIDSLFHINQAGLTQPVILGDNCDDFHNIIRQKNNFIKEKMSKRKLEDTLGKKISTNTNMSKKNRILNYEKNNCEQNNSDGVALLSKDDIELGEVLSVEKARSPIEIENYDHKSKYPVAISKKMVPIIAKRMNDLLEKTVEFIYHFSTKAGLKHERLSSILLASWFKILLIYVIENKIEFYLSKDNNFEKNSNLLDFPNEKDASELFNAIHKCHNELELENNEFDLLREMVILEENSNEPKFLEYLQEAKMKLEKTSKIDYKSGNDKLTSLLSNIQNIKINQVKSLFYPNVSVQDLLNKKIIDLTSKELIFNDELSKPEYGS